MAVYSLLAPLPTTTRDAVEPTSSARSDAFTFDNSASASDDGKPGVTAGIAVGSVAGFAVLGLVVFLGARWLGRRRQQRAMMWRAEKPESRFRPGTPSSCASSVDVATRRKECEKARDATAVREAMRVDLRRLEGGAVDQHVLVSSRAGEDTSEEVVTTGAELISMDGSSPLTPRTPRYTNGLGSSGMAEGDDGHGEAPVVLSARVRSPDKIAPMPGLGERAWHRRRLSVPFPPAREGRLVGNGASGHGDGMITKAEFGGHAGGGDDEDDWTEASSSWRWTVSTADGSCGRRVQ